MSTARTRRRTVGALLAVALLGGTAACSADEPEPTTSPSPEETPDEPSPDPSPTEEPEEPEPTPDPDPDEQDAPEAPEVPDGDAPAPDGGRVVEVLVTQAGPGAAGDVLEVVAYIPDVIEENGTCTATLRGTSTEVTVPAWADVSSTSCGLMELPVAPQAGQVVVVAYESDASVGVSEPTAVTP